MLLVLLYHHNVITVNRIIVIADRKETEMQNIDIRMYAKSKGVNLWQVSEKLGYAHETRFSRVLRHELSYDKKQEIKKIIDELAAEVGE